MGRTIAVIASIFAAAVLAGSALAAQAPAPGAFHPGDVLKYDLSVELQVHVAPAPHTTQPPISMDTTVLGTETLTGLRSDPDGSVHASVGVVMRSSGGGQSQSVQKTLLIKISPDGSMQPEGPADPALSQYLKTFSEAAKLYRNRTLHVGDVFSQTITVPGIVPVKVTSHAKVVGQQTYRGYPTFAIETTGDGKIDNDIQGMHATGTFNVAGTTYVDQKDQLFIGEAVRSNVDAVVSGSGGNRVTAVATVNLVLNSFTHGAKPKQVRPAAPAAAVSPTPAATPTPTPTPVDEYYTPTPPAPTPSPVVKPYPPPIL